MKQVASLHYGVIFKKAFSQPDIFTAFVKAVLGIQFSCDKVETEKSFRPAIGNVDSRFDLFAQDEKNLVIVDIQHRKKDSHYDRFLHYHCAAILEQMQRGEQSYRPPLAVYTIVVLTSMDKYEKDVLTIEFDPKDLTGKGIGEIPHKVIYLCPKCVNENTPIAYREWMEAIADTLDTTVDESHYHNAMIQKVFEAIEESGLTPRDRYNMIEEYEDNKFIADKEKDAALEKAKSIAKGMLAEKLPVELIAKLTGLSFSEIEKLANLRLNDEEK
jgi:predicted transposase/invertase (TIGR01784 family)